MLGIHYFIRYMITYRLVFNLDPDKIVSCEMCVIVSYVIVSWILPKCRFTVAEIELKNLAVVKIKNWQYTRMKIFFFFFVFVGRVHKGQMVMTKEIH